MEQSSATKQSLEAKDERKADLPREAGRRRFRIVKLEERIAPCNPHVGQLPNTCRPKQCW